MFYKHKFKSSLVVSLLALETYHTRAIGCESTEDLLVVVYSVLQECCGIENPTEENLLEFTSRLQKISEEAVKDPQKVPVKSKGFSTNFYKYLSELSLQNTLMLMTGFDFERARVIYCDLDRDEAIALIKDFTSGMLEQGILSFEAALYGGGNSYKEDSGEVKQLDTSESLKMLQGLGFGAM
jgi:hypothetical protein